jgi:putative AdoMet-dependent methyltransferase
MSSSGSREARPDPFPPEEFDDWAETYDQDVLDESFPFTGYERVLDTVVALSGAQAGDSVLDLGAGTGNLAARFQKLGCEVWLTDFSTAMLDRARSRLPGARFFVADLRAKSWPKELDRRFSHVVSAYVFHHLELPEKIRVVKMLIDKRLEPGGSLIIADLSFPDSAALSAVRSASGERWEEEPYWTVAETLPAFLEAGIQAKYQQISNCAGVYQIEKAKTA